MAAALGSAGTIGAGWLGKRVHPKLVQAEASERFSNSWDKLVARLEDDNKRLDERLDEAEEKIVQLRKDIHDRNGWIMALRGWASRMLHHVAAQDQRIVELGGQALPPPELPELPALN